MNFIGKLAKSPRLVNGISWAVTVLVVAVLLGFTFRKITPQQVSAASEPTPTEEGTTASIPTQEAPLSLPTTTNLDAGAQEAIVRHIVLKTEISSSTNYNIVEYTVARGDSVFGIAKAHNIKPETLLWANYDTLQDSPDSIRVGQKLNIPPTDGVYYKWQEGDTLDSIAKKLDASADDILNWPGNDIDLTNPDIKPDTYVMVPGGHREFVQWLIPSVARGRSGTASIGGAACGGGPVGSGAFVWPTGNHFISGNEYWSGHLGIDIAAGEGAPVWAADAGVVTIAQGGWNGGYGNVVMIDHGNGWVTVYGHLSQINVVPCQAVYAGTPIGLAGNTGNSFGAHLHFETRQNGGFINPHYVLPNP